MISRFMGHVATVTDVKLEASYLRLQHRSKRLKAVGEEPVLRFTLQPRVDETHHAFLRPSSCDAIIFLRSISGPPALNYGRH